jgi:signal transduction histidine kinase/CheY-like chemotaxis protein
MPDARLLVVDDEPGVALLCTRVLERAGFEVASTSIPQEGAALLQQESFDLLLVDIRMPEMDGFELMTFARRHQPNLAVVIMTGFGTVETAIEALRQGADGLILKPFSQTSELVRSVRDALQESQNKREIARLQALRPLFNITEALFTETDPERLVDLILNAICGHLRCEHAGYYHRSLGESEMTLVAGRGTPLPAGAQAIKGDPIGRADDLGISFTISADGPGESEFQTYITDKGLVSVLCAPLALNNDESSVLMAGRSLGEPVFSEADAEMFGILARQAAVALVNARLYAELRDYVRQVEESQQALIQAEKLAAVGRLMASIAHEINNPLQAVRNCLHLAGRDELPLEKRQEYLALSEAELKRLMATMQRMLNFSRPSTSDRVSADLNGLVDHVLQLLEKQLLEQNVQVHTDFSPSLPQVSVSENQIQQVFFNLILNAMDAMPSGGEIFISSGYEDGQVEVLVEDTGPGIPEDQWERIFEPFMSTRETGTGLGLSVSYNILDAHNGNLELVTGQARGACFRIVLPVMEAR